MKVHMMKINAFEQDFLDFVKRNKMLLQSLFILSSKPVHVVVKNRKAISKLKLRLSCVILRS